MALIERLMHEPFETDPARIIPVHSFFAATGELVQGALTSAQVQSFLNMTAADIVDWDALVALIPGAASGKALYIERIHGVFMLAEGRYPGYSTPAEVRSKLGI
jgi:hypothetical protein